MPAGWYKDERKDDHGFIEAEAPGSDPFDDDDGTSDDLLLSFDYRERDRDSVFDGVI